MITCLGVTCLRVVMAAVRHSLMIRSILLVLMHVLHTLAAAIAWAITDGRVAMLFHVDSAFRLLSRPCAVGMRSDSVRL